MKTTYEARAGSERGRMSVDELRAFVLSLGSLNGASGVEDVRATVTVGGYLKRVKVEVDRTPHTWPEDTQPTPEQLTDWLAVCTDAERLGFAKRAVYDSDIAWTCFMDGHVRKHVDLRER